MYNNQYTQYNPQLELEKLNAKINDMERIKAQLQQQIAIPPAINQTFQLAPNSSGIKYVNNVEDVKKELVMMDTPFFSNDLSTLWIKNVKGDIKSYELKEIVLKDERDTIIDDLKLQIEELKKEKVINHEQSNDKYINESIKNKKSPNGKSNTRINK